MRSDTFSEFKLCIEFLRCIQYSVYSTVYGRNTDSVTLYATQVVRLNGGTLVESALVQGAGI